MKKFGLLLLGVLAATFVFAQEDETGSTMNQPVRKPVEFGWEQVDVGDFSDPVAYPPIRQADVMYYYTIWRNVDLREKVNHPLYFPTETRGTWRSLAQTIFDAVDLNNPEKTEGVLPVYADEMCTVPFSRDEIRGNLSEVSQIPEIDIETGEEIGMKEMVIEYEPKQVISYNVKEVWYFDKQASKFYVQILEIEPIIEHERANNSFDFYDEGSGNQEDEEDVRGTMMKKRVGYIYYNELRPFLAKQEVFNVKNNAQRLSFDDLLTWKRDFTSYIYKEANVYDRDIADYIANSRDQRLESEKITDKLRTIESDLWAF
ncbi:MAG: gliding motility protein GldN [Bacteroidales bacterium]|nr:gliding motility protein GldN [Bacteroidales bacterium]